MRHFVGRGEGVTCTATVDRMTLYETFWIRIEVTNRRKSYKSRKSGIIEHDIFTIRIRKSRRIWLRIDNSWQGMIRATLLYSAAILSTVSYYTSIHRSYFSLSMRSICWEHLCFYEFIDFKPIFPLLFSKHGYPADYSYPSDNIFYMCF